MKWSFFINQEAIANAGLLDKTDVFDWMILSYIKEWGDTKQGLRKGTKTWINYKHLMGDMPLLGIKHKGALSKKVKKLVELGLLETELDVVEQKLYAETTTYYSKILYSKKGDSTVSREQRTVSREQRTVSREQRTVSREKRSVSVGKPIHIPVFIHQDSFTKYKKTETENQILETPTKKTTLPDNFSVSEKVLIWYCSKNYTENIQDHLEAFVDICRANGYRKIDWDATFKNCIRADWAGIRKNNSHASNQRFLTKEQQREAYSKASGEVFLDRIRQKQNTFDGEVVHASFGR